MVKNGQEVFLTKSNFDISEICANSLFIKQNDLHKFVSRGGLKLEAALKHLKLDVENMQVLDVGQSTGGFTDCLLQNKVKSVVGIDVGQEQLHKKLRNHLKVTFFESLHVNLLAVSQNFLQSVPVAGFDLIVADVSFISLTKVMSHLNPYLRNKGLFLFLVKPQFELDSNALDKNGIVKDEKNYSIVQNQVQAEAIQVFGQVKDYFKSELQGKDGNQEFFIYGQKQS